MPGKMSFLKRTVPGLMASRLKLGNLLAGWRPFSCASPLGLNNEEQVTKAIIRQRAAIRTRSLIDAPILITVVYFS